MNKLNWIKHW